MRPRARLPKKPSFMVVAPPPADAAAESPIGAEAPRAMQALGEGVSAFYIYSGVPKAKQNFNYYAVRSGRKRGVFKNCKDAKAQTRGFEGAEPRGARSVDKAAYFIRHGATPPRNTPASTGATVRAAERARIDAPGSAETS